MEAEFKNELKEIAFIFLTFPVTIPMMLLLDYRNVADLGRKLPYRPRFFNWVWSVWGRFFWLPCPICKHNFGGHEPGGSLYTGNGGGGWMVCPKCTDKANALNKEKFGYEPMEGK